MEKGFRARVVVKPRTPLDMDLILADFATFNVYYRREVWQALDDILHDRNLLVKVANGLQHVNLAIAKVMGASVPPDPRDTLLAAQRLIEKKEHVIKYAVSRDFEANMITVELEMPRWFLLVYQMTSMNSAPFVAQWYSKKALQQSFKKLVEGYFNPKKQPYDVVEITFDPGGEPAKGTS